MAYHSEMMLSNQNFVFKVAKKLSLIILLKKIKGKLGKEKGKKEKN